MTTNTQPVTSCRENQGCGNQVEFSFSLLPTVSVLIYSAEMGRPCMCGQVLVLISFKALWVTPQAESDTWKKLTLMFCGQVCCCPQAFFNSYIHTVISQQHHFTSLLLMIKAWKLKQWNRIDLQTENRIFTLLFVYLGMNLSRKTCTWHENNCSMEVLNCHIAIIWKFIWTAKPISSLYGAYGWVHLKIVKAQKVMRKHKLLYPQGKAGRFIWKSM